MNTDYAIRSSILRTLRDGQSRVMADIMDGVRSLRATADATSIQILSAMNQLRMDGMVIIDRRNDGVTRTRFQLAQYQDDPSGTPETGHHATKDPAHDSGPVNDDRRVSGDSGAPGTQLTLF